MTATRPRYVERPEVETIVVGGDDRLEWLQGVLTCDVAGLGPGVGSWGLALTKPGKILTDVYLVPSKDAVLLGVAGGTAQDVIDWFDEFIIMEDVELELRSGEMSWVALHGNGALDLADRVARANEGWLSASIPWTSAGGAALVGPKTRVETVRGMLAQDGEALDAEGWLRFRIESLLPLYGVDYDSSRNPHEASLDRRAVSWTKGCYLGQEAVCMQDMRGKVKRRLVTISIDDPVPPANGAPVQNAANEPVGTVTSASRAADGRAIALATVRAQYAESGATLVVGGKAARVVVAPPPASSSPRSG